MNPEKTKQKIKRSHRQPGVFAVVLFFIFIIAATVQGRDQAPPYLASPLPPPESEDISPHTSITVLIVDDGQGLNAESIYIEIEETVVEPIIEMSEDFSEAKIVYEPPEDFESGEWIEISTTAADNAGNLMMDGWKFRISDSKSDYALVPIFPTEGTWIDYSTALGVIRFSWTESKLSECYRMSLLDKASEMEYLWDIGQEDYDEAFGICTIEVGGLCEATWNELTNEMGYSWRVTSADCASGESQQPYSEEQDFVFAATDAVTLILPADGALLSSRQAPTFRWEIDNRSLGYIFALAQVDENGDFTGNSYSAMLPLFVTELPVSIQNWSGIAEGRWVWTVISMRMDGEFSSYMLRQFRKSEDE